MSFWDKIAFAYDFAQSFNGEVIRRFEKITTELVSEGSLVLDTAAGTGKLTFAAAKKAEMVICTDASMPMLEVARKKAEKNNINNVIFSVRDIFNLSDNDETYDVVMAGNVLHIISEPEMAVRELMRVTKTGGKLLLPTYIDIDKSSFLIPIYKKLGYNANKSYSCQEYLRMLKGCGVKKIKYKTLDGILPCCYAVIEKGK